ncbi:MAG TPA: hypothetical protein VGI35_07245 [Steroidobacteraceae bacterium]
MLAPVARLAPVALFALGIACGAARAAPRDEAAQAAPSARTAGGDCDERCLDTLARTYLAALAAHDPSRLPTTKDVRFTENTIELPLGQGLWTTFSGLKRYVHIIPDPDSGQVGLYAAIDENGTGALLVARLRLRAGRVSELETLIVRASDMGTFLKTDATEARPGFKEVVPPAKRESRQELIRAANLYFEGLEQRTGDIVPFSDQCMRFENGTQTAGAPLPGIPPRPPIKLPDGRTFSMPTGCKAGFNTKMFSYISRIDHRRYPVVDRSRGVVMSFVTFQHEGNVKSAEVPGVGEVPMFASALHPFAVVIAETFEIKNGKIREIEADMTKLPYGAGTGWTP